MMKVDRDILSRPEYGFLWEDRRLGANICLLVLGGSKAYGTDIETSDTDIRGVAVQTKEDILLGKDFEQVVDTDTDTVIYSLPKMLRLLREQNPNILEILFVRPEHVLFADRYGKMLLENRERLLTKNIFKTCGGYAREQLRRLDNKTARELSQEMQEAHILNSIKSARDSFPKQYFSFDSDSINLYLDDAVKEGGLDKEIFMDVTLSHYPLRDYLGMWNAMNSILKDYNKAGKRARSAYARGAINKHAMHLTRLLLLAERALRTGRFCTYMKEDHDLLMAIRRGDYTGDDGQMKPEFFAMVDRLEKKMRKAYENSPLPEDMDREATDRLLRQVNESIIESYPGRKTSAC